MKDWEKIGYVAGFGTTTEPKHYSFTDENISSGTYHYRLTQIDFDGTFEYSQEVEVVVSAPNEFSLSQNYPNPFNPTTTIKYAIPADMVVTLSVYNILGEKVTDIVNELQKAGRYEVTFDATNQSDGKSSLSSGLYFYRFEAGNFIAVKKMVLLK